MNKSYLTHHNGDRPYLVNCVDGNVSIYAKNKKSEQHSEFIGMFHPSDIFIGKSPKECGGESFDGNTMLLKMDILNYIFIGEKIVSFKTDYEIINFVSPVGNSDVPYPYAIDEQQQYYFMQDCAILTSVDPTYDCPYHYYFVLKNIKHIEYIFIGNHRYNATTDVNPSEHYDSLIERLGKPLYIKYKGEQETKETTKHEYVELLKTYNQTIGLTPFKSIHYIDDTPPGM